MFNRPQLSWGVRSIRLPLATGMRRPRLAVAAGFLGTIPVVAASYLAAGAACAVYDRLPAGVQRSDGIGYVLNDVAPLLSGVACAGLLVAALTHWRAFVATWRAHLARTWTWYALAAGVEWIVRAYRSSGDFGLWSQVVTWPQAALVGALLTDAVATGWRGRRHRSNVALQQTARPASG